MTPTKEAGRQQRGMSGGRFKQEASGKGEGGGKDLHDTDVEESRKGDEKGR